MRTTIAFILCTFHIFTFAQEPEPFIKDIVSQFPNVRDIAITHDGKEAVFSAQSIMGDISALVSVKKEGDSWSEPVVISFSGQYFDLEPFFSKDGLDIYFVSDRPIDQKTSDKKDFDIWYAHRQSRDAEWEIPKNLGAPINTTKDEFYPVITDSGNLYFTMDDPELKQKDNIYISKFVDGHYTTPEILSEKINSPGYEFNAFVAPDESYLIYSCYNRKDGKGSGDLYISYNNNGIWSESKNLMIVNSNKMDYCPFVDTKTNTLYFTSKRLGDYWNRDSKKTIDEVQKLFKKYDNGLSRLYKINLEPFYKN